MRSSCLFLRNQDFQAFTNRIIGVLHTSLAQAAEDMEHVNGELLQQRQRFQHIQGSMQTISDSQAKVEGRIEANAAKLEAVHDTAKDLGEGMAASLSHLVRPVWLRVGALYALAGASILTHRMR